MFIWQAPVFCLHRSFEFEIFSHWRLVQTVATPVGILLYNGINSKYITKSSKLTAADGISRRPFSEPLIEEDDELKEDSFIAPVHSDIFDLNVDNTTTPKKNRKPWTSITIGYENDDLGTSTEEVVPTINDPLNVADGYNVHQLQRQSPDFIPIFDYLEQGICPTMTKQQEN